MEVEVAHDESNWVCFQDINKYDGNPFDRAESRTWYSDLCHLLLATEVPQHFGVKRKGSRKCGGGAIGQAKFLCSLLHNRGQGTEVNV